MSIAYHKARQRDESEEIWKKPAGGEVKIVKEEKGENMEVVQRRLRGCCTPRKLQRKLPILKWLPKYNTDDLIGDVVAGLTVGLTVIPQGIAYAMIAGLPPNYGLYSSFFGSFLYVIFGSCKDITIGPTAVMSILTYEYTAGDPETAILLCFTSGVLILLFGLFNLGFLISLVSKPVISGFTSAAAITIFTSQLKGLLGIKVHAHGLIDTWIQVFKHITETRWQDLTMGLVCITILLVLRKVKELERFKKREGDPLKARALKMSVFLISVGRNAIVVILATVLSASLDDNQPFTITGPVKPGLPHPEVPSFTIHNGTMSFMDVMAKAGSGVIILPLIAILENIAIASAFSGGKTIDATQEMIALGICNLGNSFFQAMPTTGSFSRTAVNATSGVRTTAGGIVTGVVIVLALAVLTPFFKYIPLSALAAVIICAVIFTIEYHEIVPIWRVRKADELVLWTSFLVCIFWKLEFGIVIGVVLNLALQIIVEANPKIKVDPRFSGECNMPPHVLVCPRSGLVYLNEDRVRTRIAKAAQMEGRGVLPIVVSCENFARVDYSAAKGMEALAKDFTRRGQPLLFTLASENVERSIKALNARAIFVEHDALAEYLQGLQCVGRLEEPAVSSNEEKSLITPIDESKPPPV